MKTGRQVGPQVGVPAQPWIFLVENEEGNERNLEHVILLINTYKAFFSTIFSKILLHKNDFNTLSNERRQSGTLHYLKFGKPLKRGKT